MNNYKLLAPFQNKNAGFSRWTFATRGGREYFIKEFLSPVYPIDDSLSYDRRIRKIKDCEEYEIQKKELYSKINEVSRGNIVRIAEFFRYDSHYYVATEKINAYDIAIEELKAFPFDNRVLLCKSIAYEIRQLHRAHIVHADLKLDNILLKRTEGKRLVGKIIDFDASFFEQNPPRYEDELSGDQVYLAPEACKFICGEEIDLTCKMDVFALGLIFHQYLTGEFPGYDKDEYDYAYDAVLDGQELKLSSELSPQLTVLFKGMLACEPESRFSMEEVYGVFEKIDPDKANESPSSAGWFSSAGDL